MKTTLTRRAGLTCLIAALALGPGCTDTAPTQPPPGAGPTIAFDAHRRMAAPVVVGNLTVWPIQTDDPLDLGPFVTLREAQQKKQAKVHEKKTRAGTDGAEVNKLVVSNTGDVPILIPAGTVLKGGKQDRQVGQDVVISAKSEIEIDTFCVERGRWNATKADGKLDYAFEAQETVAPKGVRFRAVYTNDQQAVWDAVQATNHAAGKKPQTETLMATLEDPKRESRRRAVRESVGTHFTELRKHERDWVTVGFAYSINGKPVAVRAFAHPKLFVQQFEAFLKTMALEADVATDPKSPHTAAADPQQVLSFVAGFEKAKVSDTRRSGATQNLYKTTKRGGNAECLIEVEGELRRLSQDWTVR